MLQLLQTVKERHDRADSKDQDGHDEGVEAELLPVPEGVGIGRLGRAVQSEQQQELIDGVDNGMDRFA